MRNTERVLFNDSDQCLIRYTMLSHLIFKSNHALVWNKSIVYITFRLYYDKNVVLRNVILHFFLFLKKTGHYWKWIVKNLYKLFIIRCVITSMWKLTFMGACYSDIQCNINSRKFNKYVFCFEAPHFLCGVRCCTAPLCDRVLNEPTAEAHGPFFFWTQCQSRTRCIKYTGYRM